LTLHFSPISSRNVSFNATLINRRLSARDDFLRRVILPVSEKNNGKAVLGPPVTSFETRNFEFGERVAVS